MKLKSAVAFDDVSVGCLVPIAPVTMSGRYEFAACGIGALDFTGVKVSSFAKSGARPNEAINHQDVHGGDFREGSLHRALPERLPRGSAERVEYLAVHAGDPEGMENPHDFIHRRRAILRDHQSDRIVDERKKHHCPKFERKRYQTSRSAAFARSLPLHIDII